MNPTFVIIQAYMLEKCSMMERKLHDKFSEKRLSGEWFDLSYDDIRDLIRAIAPQGATWLHEIDERYSDYEIERMIRCAFSGVPYAGMEEIES